MEELFEELNEELCLLTGQELDTPASLSTWTVEDVQRYFDSDGSICPETSVVPARQQQTTEAGLNPVVPAAQLQTAEAGVNQWRVVHSPRVVVRVARSIEAAMAGTRAHGEVLDVVELVDGWVKLAGAEQWMLVDGTSLGLGTLLEPLVPAEVSMSLRMLRADTAEPLINLDVTSWSGSNITLAECILRFPYPF